MELGMLLNSTLCPQSIFIAKTKAKYGYFVAIQSLVITYFSAPEYNPRGTRCGGVSVRMYSFFTHSLRVMSLRRRFPNRGQNIHRTAQNNIDNANLSSPAANEIQSLLFFVKSNRDTTVLDYDEWCMTYNCRVNIEKKYGRTLLMIGFQIE